MNEKAADSVNSNTEENYQTWESLSKVVKFESEKQKGFLWQICFKITQNEPISSVVICAFPCDRDLLTTCLHNVKLRFFEERMSFWSIFFWVIGVAFVILRKTQHFLFTERKYTAGKKRESRRWNKYTGKTWPTSWAMETERSSKIGCLVSGWFDLLFGTLNCKWLFGWNDCNIDLCVFHVVWTVNCWGLVWISVIGMFWIILHCLDLICELH